MTKINSFIHCEDVLIEDAASIKLSELSVGESRFYEDKADYCDIYALRPATDVPNTFIVTPLWADHNGDYHSNVQRKNSTQHQEFVVLMNEEVFRDWQISPHSEYADDFSSKDGTHNFTAAHIQSFLLDSDYIHNPESKYSVEYRVY